MANLTGQQIEHYQVGERLAKGGMAEVYLAYDPRLRRRAVLKVMLPSLADDKEFIRRFEREAQAIANLRHANIVQVYATGTTPDQRPYIAMEYVPAGTLADWLERRGGQPLPANVVMKLGEQIAKALGEAHRRGIVHRDLKPSNILMMEDGTPLITDLGIASILDDTTLTATGKIFGTPHYMSPEQGKGERADARSDIYSLGVILYELLAGQRPFDGETGWAIIHQHIHEQPPSLSKIRPDLSQNIVSTVERCLAKNPSHRYQTATSLAKKISNFQVENDVIQTNLEPIIIPNKEVVIALSLILITIVLILIIIIFSAFGVPSELGVGSISTPTIFISNQTVPTSTLFTTNSDFVTKEPDTDFSTPTPEFFIEPNGNANEVGFATPTFNSIAATSTIIATETPVSLFCVEEGIAFYWSDEQVSDGIACSDNANGFFRAEEETLVVISQPQNIAMWFGGEGGCQHIQAISVQSKDNPDKIGWVALPLLQPLPFSQISCRQYQITPSPPSNE